VHKRGKCQGFFREDGNGGRVMQEKPIHSKLLGGHGDDTIHAGPIGDVIWGDYKPKGQPTTQHDRLYGGAGKDYIYASHGYNRIEGRGGRDYIKAHFGRGIIDCGSGKDTVEMSRRARPHYKIRHCERVAYKSLGY
jgi:Ca2+-binding RTX toxin-like protein